MKSLLGVLSIVWCFVLGACSPSGAPQVAGTGGLTGTDASGTGGIGVGEPVPAESIAGTPNINGVALIDSFILMPCFGTALADCVTSRIPCPASSDATVPYERQGLVNEEVFPLGGTTGRLYKLTVRVNGIAEAKYYTGGTRAAGLSAPQTPDAPEGTDTFYTGGQPVAVNSFNVYKFIVKDADGVELQHYYLNSFPSPIDGVAAAYEGHATYPISFTHEIVVPGGGTFTLYSNDRNCRTVDNCGIGYHPLPCAVSEGRMVPNEPDLSIPASYLGKPVADMNARNGAAQPFHSQAFHIVVLAAAAL
ncbi:MAG TPA: hypothetical protein VFH68_21195 [Polyangia bacterium]|nr:hypothetical protein [Polyangia bacterium]